MDTTETIWVVSRFRDNESAISAFRDHEAARKCYAYESWKGCWTTLRMDRVPLHDGFDENLSVKKE